jgi:hypothetical protein
VSPADQPPDDRNPPPALAGLEETMAARRPFANGLVGLGEAEARRAVESRGLVLRVITPDQPVITAALVPRRVNLRVDGGVVREAFVG